MIILKNIIKKSIIKSALINIKKQNYLIGFGQQADYFFLDF